MANEVDINLGTFDLDSTNGIAIESINIAVNKTLQEFDIPKADGAVIPITKRKDITVRLRGSIAAANHDALRTALNALKNAIESSSEQKFTTDDDYYLKGQYKSFSYEVVTIRTFLKFSLELAISYPFWVSNTLTSSTPAWTTGVGFTVNNPGTAPARLKVTVTSDAGGSIVDDIRVDNTTTGETFQYRGTVGASKALVVNNRVDNVDLVVTNDSTSDFSNFYGDFITLNPGNNTLKLTCARSGAVLALAFRETNR